MQRSVGKSYGEWKRTQGKVSHPVGVPAAWRRVLAFAGRGEARGGGAGRPTCFVSQDDQEAQGCTTVRANALTATGPFSANGSMQLWPNLISIFQDRHGRRQGT